MHASGVSSLGNEYEFCHPCKLGNAVLSMLLWYIGVGHGGQGGHGLPLLGTLVVGVVRFMQTAQ